MRTFLALATALLSAGAAASTYDLPATPQTVAWGNYDAAAKPVLNIKSGDTVVVHTLLTNSPTGLEKDGVAPDRRSAGAARRSTTRFRRPTAAPAAIS